MKIRTSAMALAVAVSLTSFSASARAGECPLSSASHQAHHVARTPVSAELPSIVAAAASNKDFSTLVAAVKAAGLVETLQGKGPFTVFAPTDQAFAKLPKGTIQTLLKPENKGKLASILTYHVVPGAVFAEKAVKLDGAKSVQGTRIPFELADGKLKVGGANVVKADIACANGVIHVIDRVILPADIVDTAVAAGDFSTLVAAVQAAGLVDTLKGDGPFTVFAPTNEAFEALPQGTVASLLKPENKSKLTKILTYHVVPGKVLAKDVVKLSSAESVQGGRLDIAADANGVRIGNANVVAADIECGNGVIHVIDSVLLP